MQIEASTVKSLNRDLVEEIPDLLALYSGKLLALVQFMCFRCQTGGHASTASYELWEPLYHLYHRYHSTVLILVVAL